MATILRLIQIPTATPDTFNFRSIRELSEAFSPDDQCRLALLHLFQGFVNVDALCMMGHPNNPGSVVAVHGLTLEEGVALLDRAVEIGLLMGRGNGYYDIQPAGPRFLKTVFERCHPAPDAELSATLAYTVAMGGLGILYHGQFNAGHHHVLDVLQAEEHNLLHAYRLALINDWWEHLIGSMQGLRILYTNSGRWETWQRLVSEAAPVVTTPDEEPRPGREEMWGIIIDYQVALAGQRRDGGEVMRLLRQLITVRRPVAAALLALNAESNAESNTEFLGDEQRNQVRNLGASLLNLGMAQTDQDDPDALPSLMEAHDLYRRIGDCAAEATAAFNLGHAYLQISAIRDFVAAERWYQASLSLREDYDHAGKARCYGQLGSVALECFDALRAAPDPDKQTLLRHWQQAETSYQQALILIPVAAVAEQGVFHTMLGRVYDRAENSEQAMDHYRKAIAYHEQADNRFGAGQTRYNLSKLLAQAGNLSDALDFAHAARDDWASFGPNATKDVANADRLIAFIEAAQPRPITPASSPDTPDTTRQSD